MLSPILRALALLGPAVGVVSVAVAWPRDVLVYDTVVRLHPMPHLDVRTELAKREAVWRRETSADHLEANRALWRAAIEDRISGIETSGTIAVWYGEGESIVRTLEPLSGTGGALTIWNLFKDGATLTLQQVPGGSPLPLVIEPGDRRLYLSHAADMFVLGRFEPPGDKLAGPTEDEDRVTWTFSPEVFGKRQNMSARYHDKKLTDMMLSIYRHNVEHVFRTYAVRDWDGDGNPTRILVTQFDWDGSPIREEEYRFVGRHRITDPVPPGAHVIDKRAMDGHEELQLNYEWPGYLPSVDEALSMGRHTAARASSEDSHGLLLQAVLALFLIALGAKLLVGCRKHGPHVR